MSSPRFAPALCALFMIAGSFSPLSAAPALEAVYLGQDGHDYCSPDNRLAPDDIQDLHVRLEGLDQNQSIVEGNFVRAAGGQWTYWTKPQPTPHFRAQILRAPGSATADVFLEPSNDDQHFDLSIDLKYANGGHAQTTVHCGRSDPNLFMPQATLAAEWVGQDGHDLTGPSPSVGPDRIQDVRIDLKGLSKLLEIHSIRIDARGAGQWECGPNRDRLNDAELVWDGPDRSTASLFFSPNGNLRDRMLGLTVTYANERSQHIAIEAGATDASLPMPAVPPITLNNELSKSVNVKWLGQNAADGHPAARGAIHVRVEGLGDDRRILAAAISDIYGGYWIWCPREVESSFYATPQVSSDFEPLKAPTDPEKFALLSYAHGAARPEPDSLQSLFDALPLLVYRGSSVLQRIATSLRFGTKPKRT